MPSIQFAYSLLCSSSTSNKWEIKMVRRFAVLCFSMVILSSSMSISSKAYEDNIFRLNRNFQFKICPGDFILRAAAEVCTRQNHLQIFHQRNTTTFESVKRDLTRWYLRSNLYTREQCQRFDNRTVLYNVCCNYIKVGKFLLNYCPAYHRG